MMKYQPKCVQFQLVVILQEAIDRQQLMPSSLNYFGLLGPHGKNFGQMTYHCQDCVLENAPFRAIQFKISEEHKMNSNLEAVIQSDTSQVGVQLREVTIDQQQKNNTKQVGEQLAKGKQLGTKNAQRNQNSEKMALSDDQIQSFSNYVFVIVNDKAKTESKAVFNLRLEISESIKRAPSHHLREHLPESIEEIARYKVRTEGLKESEFIIGTKFMLDWVDTNRLQPFVPKSDQVYQARYKDSKGQTFALAIPFEVEEEESEVYAAVYDYTGLSNLGLSIFKESDFEDFEVNSVPGKYHSWIEPVSLTRGDYFLIVEPQTDFHNNDNLMIKFGLDFLYEKENITDNDSEILFDSMEICGLPLFPQNLNSPQYLHHLTGSSVQLLQHYRIQEALLGESLRFEITEDSLINFYVELPKAINANAELFKTKGTHRTKVSTKNLNYQNENFLRQKDLTHQNVIEFREFLNPGVYDILVHASELEEENVYAMPRCQSFKVGLSISPLKNAHSKKDEACSAPVPLGSKMEFDKLSNGILRYDIHENIFDTSYINLENHGEGPFLIYFTLGYDIQQEGPLAVVVSKYDADSLLFEEQALYEVQDQQSQLITVVDEGTYVLSIQGLQSTQNKFVMSGLGKAARRKDINLFGLPCLTLQYSYLVASVNPDDTQVARFSIMDALAALFSGDLNKFKGQDSDQSAYDKSISRDIKELQSTHCRADIFPSQIALQDSGFDKTYVFKMSKKNYEIIDVVSEESALLRVFLKQRNPKNNINVFLYQDSKMNNLIAFAEASKFSKDFLTSLKPQKKAYKLKIVYDSLDENDDCPLYDFRLAMKPIENLMEENLKCTGLPTTPEEIRVTQDNFDLDDEFSVSSEFIEKFGDKKTLSYDIAIYLPNSNYYIDIETKSDFLTSNIDISLFGVDEQSNEMIGLGRSEWVNEENSGDNFAFESPLNYVSKDFVKRLRMQSSREYLNENQSLSGKYILRLKFSRETSQLIQILKSKELLTRDNQACFPFDLSIRATQMDTNEFEVNAQNELIRIDWSTKLQEQFVDPRMKLTAFLQFRYSIEESYKSLKFKKFVYLKPEDSTSPFDLIYPSTVRLSSIDKSSLVVTFKQNSLEKGKCFNLKIDKNQLEEKYEESLFGTSSKVCTTNCLCNPKGTKQCDEKLGVCECHYPFEGHDCSYCGFGHILDPATLNCVRLRKCKDDGGDEDCNNHGICYEDEQTGQAMCDCDQGFINDGNDQCAKCSDPMFSYPRCQVRNWILEDSDINCKDLPSRIPKYLFNAGNESNETFQNDEGLLQWFGRYRLVGEKYKKKTIHHFMVPTNSVLRLFFDTLESGVKVKYTILDDSKQVLLSTTQEEPYLESDVVFEFLSQTENHKSSENPFTLVLEYAYDKDGLAPNSCPMIDINFIVQPFNKIQKHLQCSEVELSLAKEGKQFDWTFSGLSQYFSEQFTLSSDMAPEKTPFYIAQDNEYFMIMKYQLNIVESGNALSILASYNFESMQIPMSLIDKKTNNIIAIENVVSLEDVQGEDEVISLDNDMVSAIEIPSINSGAYELQVLIQKSLFLPTKAYRTCLNFDFTLEYIARTISKEQEISQDLAYEVITVYPAKLKRIRPTAKGKVDVRFNQALDIDSFVNNENDLHKICYLENLTDKSQTIKPYKVMNTKAEQLTLYFNFKKAKIADDGSCYTLKCSTQNTVGKELIKPIQVETNYCFKQKDSQNDGSQCNPFAFPKYVDNKCICTYPYKGETCEQCESGYYNTKDKKGSKHSVCVLDETICSSDICNNHGTCLKDPAHAKSTDQMCRCEERYDGQFCEKCKDPALAYPDCDSIRSDIYDESVDKEYLSRRKYNSDGYERFKKETSKPQCSWTSYPKDLNTVENLGFVNGDFHIADFYTINHDQDNQIYFTPKAQGTIKLFIQQPEEEELIINDEVFDFEIGLYDVTKEKFVASGMNHHLNLKTAGINGKLEYASLIYSIPQESVNKPFILMFRALNFTIKSDDIQCETAYMELEFREQPRACQYQKAPSKSSEIIRVSPDSPYAMNDLQQVHTVQNDQNTFFSYQDYYLEDLLDQDSQFDLTLSIQQKFIEKNQIDFLLEVLESDVDFNEINRSKHMIGQNGKPQCDDICLISGQKAYNEFHNIIEIPARTYFRVWLFQTENDGSCANYQLFVKASKHKPASTIEQLSNLKCEELDMPTSLNTARYLGDKKSNQKQQSFHYLERFRVDNLQNESAHGINFELQEPTLIRIAAPIHKHIELDLELRQSKLRDGSWKWTKIIQSAAKDFEDQIFAQLDAGTYSLKLLFFSDAFFMNQPCQSVQLQLAMTPLSEVRTFEQSQQGMEQVDFSFEGVIYSPTRSIQAQKSNAISTFSTANPQSIQEFQSYVELYKKNFFVPPNSNIGAMISVSSDFLLNDINFALTHITSNTVLHNVKRENINKLVSSSLLEGEYELTIYTHQCLTNMQSGFLENLNSQYLVDLNFIRWSHQDDFKKHYATLNVDGRQIRVEIDTVDMNEEKCYTDYQIMPEDLKAFGLGSIDMSSYFMIPEIDEYDHQMGYEPSADQDALRIIVERPNTKVIVQTSGRDSQTVAQSFSAFNGEVQVLIATELMKGSQYIIKFDFDPVENFEEEEGSFCQPFKLSIWSTTSKNICLNGASSDSNPAAIRIAKDQFEKVSTILTQRESGLVQAFSIEEDVVDLEVTYDFTNILYMPTLRLATKQSREVETTAENIKKAIHQEVKAAEIVTEVKNQVKYRFSKLKKGDYQFVFYQSLKPKACTNQFTVNIQASKPADSSLFLTKELFGMVKTYMSQQEIDDINRYVEILPISLDTFKYLKDEPFMLVSEYVQISDVPSSNKVSFTVSKNATLFRLYIENNELLVTLKEKVSGKIIQDWKQTSMLGRLDQGQYEIVIDFYTEMQRKKYQLVQNKIHMTFMFSEQDFFDNVYFTRHGNNLQDCEKSTNFPLSLNKKSELATSELEAVYDYPLLRLGPDVLREEYIINTYSFRVNQTSRFFMTLGMHMIANHLSLTLSDIRNLGNSYVGKQEFNLNVLDIVLSPGDYTLAIDQPQLFEKKEKDFCGIFSFYSKITPISEMNGNNGQTSQSKCEVKQVLPNKIYNSEEATKSGLEYFVNSQGTFFRAFENLLYKKSKYSQFNPEFERLQVSPREDAILSLMIQYKKKGNLPIVRVYDSFSFSDVDNTVGTSEEDAAGSIVEKNYIFKLSKGHEYTLFIYYQGEMSYDQDGQELCEYYNAYLSIDHFSFMAKELQCIDESNAKSLKSFVQDVPNQISERDLDSNDQYHFSELVQMKYPQDFDTLSEVDDRDLILLTTDIKLPSNFNLESSIKYDFPFGLFGLGLFDEQRQDDQQSQIEDVAEHLPLLTVGGDEYEQTMMRTLTSNDLSANRDYILAFEEVAARKLFDQVAQYQSVHAATQSSLCMYMEVELTITKQKPLQALQQQTPMIVSASPKMSGKNSLKLDPSKQEVTVTLKFNTPPMTRNQIQNNEAGTAPKDQLAELVVLQFANANTGKVLYSKRPIRIQSDKRGLLWNFVYEIKEEQSKNKEGTLAYLVVDQSRLVDTQGRPFNKQQGVQLPVFQLQNKLTFGQRKQQNQNYDSDIKILKDDQGKKFNRKYKIGGDDVKCRCVHGTCPKGSSICNRCDEGWEGVLCDIKTRPNNINNHEGENQRSKIQNIKPSGVKESQIRTSDYTQPSQREQDPTFDLDWEAEIYRAKQSQVITDKQKEFSQEFKYKDYNLWDALYQFALSFTVVGVLVGGGYWYFTRGSQLRDYMQISLNEEDSDENPNEMLELSDLRPVKSSNKRKKQPQESNAKAKEASRPAEQDLNDHEARKLNDELMLYADYSEQDQDHMLAGQSPEARQRHDQEQPQQVNETETVNEIDDMLRDMGDQDYQEEDNDDEHAELKKFI